MKGLLAILVCVSLVGCDGAVQYVQDRERYIDNPNPQTAKAAKNVAQDYFNRLVVKVNNRFPGAFPNRHYVRQFALNYCENGGNMMTADLHQFAVREIECNIIMDNAFRTVN